MEWVTPQHEEIDLNCEVSSYANAEDLVCVTAAKGAVICERAGGNARKGPRLGAPGEDSLNGCAVQTVALCEYGQN